MKYRLEHISTLSIARFGCLLGWVVTVIPSLACGLVAWRLAVAARAWLEGLRQITVNVLGAEFSFELIQILHLEQVLAALRAIEADTLPLLVILVIGVGILGGGLIAITLVVLGWGYNLLAWLTGGVVVDLQPVPSPPVQR
jgi:hypothetical protein